MLSKIVPINVSRDHGDGECYLECIDCSSFKRAEHLTDAPTADPVFENLSIDAIFRYKWFIQDDDISKPAMLQSLRLCTMLLYASLPFWHTIFFGEVVVLRDRAEGVSKQILFINERTELTEEEEALTLARLEELAGRIVLELEDGGEDCSSCDLAEEDEDDPDAKPSVVILLNRKLYGDLERVVKHRTDIVKDSWVQVEGAGTLGHEMAHAVMVLTHGDILEAYFEGSQVSEEGFERERRTFGGILKAIYRTDKGPARYVVDGTPSALDKMIVMQEWPNAQTLALYRHKKWEMGNMGSLFDVSTTWNIPVSYVVNLLQAS